MNTECKWRSAPASVRIPVPAKLLSLYRAISDERTWANEYAQSSDAWKRGMKRDCVLEGIIGEYGPSAYLALHGIKHEWNPKRVPGGDGDTDIVCYGQRIQIKSGVRWIRRVDNLNRMLPLNFDICLFATVDLGFAYVDLDGWVFRDALLKMRLGKRRPQGHINIECSPIDFDPMPSLVSRLVETPEHQAFLDS